MSVRVLVIPEDPTHNGYILKPLVEMVLAEAGGSFSFAPRLPSCGTASRRSWMPEPVFEFGRAHRPDARGGRR